MERIGYLTRGTQVKLKLLENKNHLGVIVGVHDEKGQVSYDVNLDYKIKNDDGLPQTGNTTLHKVPLDIIEIYHQLAANQN